MRACCFLFESAPSLLMNCGWGVQSGSVVGCVRVLLTWLIHVFGVESSIGEWKLMCGVGCWRLVVSV